MLKIFFSLVILASAASAQQKSDVAFFTKEELFIADVNQKFFSKLVNGLKSDLYRGRAQNFSAFNLDLQTFIHLRKNPILNTETFNLASDGNQIIHGVPVWPIQGHVAFYANEVLKMNGQEVRLAPLPNVIYFIESDLGHKERMQRWSGLKNKMSYQDYSKASGKILGIVQMDLTRMSIDFFQVDPDTKEMIPAGVFTGTASQ